MTRNLEAAVSAAREAGRALREGFGWQHSIRYKGEVRPRVTRAMFSEAK